MCSAMQPPSTTRPQVPIRELRQNLSRHLRRVAAGTTLEVTAHGRPVAILGPLPEAQTPLDRLIATGRVLPAREPWSSLGAPVDPPPGALAISDALMAERDDST
ncbi:MAG: type II toxin-antitoxin system Phd/YefM family antitoxin [Solirubrobacteraceae bacterium]